MSMHPVRWQAPQPLWARFGEGSAAVTAADQTRPAILRFATDEFMEQMLGTLANDPSRLDAVLARPETWRTPAAEPDDLIERTPVPRLVQSSVRRTLTQRLKSSIGATTHEAEFVEQAQTVMRPLKLYQPAHQRFYLVSASLVCGVPGLPERAVVPGGAEQVNFVIRRLLPPTTANSASLHEFAYVKDPEGARWQRVASGSDEDRLVPGEELLPVFPLAFQDDTARTRTLWTGLVPVGRREELITATVDRTVAPSLTLGQRAALGGVERPAKSPSKQARLAQFQMEVAEPWKNLIRASFATAASLEETATSTEPLDRRRNRIFEHNLQQQNTSWLILLDFADYLEAHLSDVWTVITNDGAGATSLPDNRKKLYEWLDRATMSDSLKTALKETDTASVIRQPQPSLRAALSAIRASGVREKLEAIELNYAKGSANTGNPNWPPFHFVLAGINVAFALDGPIYAPSLPAVTGPGEVDPDPQPSPGTAEEEALKLDQLTTLVGRALETRVENDAPPLPFALQLRNALRETAGDAGWFIIRFVYTRRDCGPLHPPVLSAATQRFQLASFFDPDAPARPIRVTLPLDTSPAGLRKFNRNTAFVVSDMLCGQIQRAKGMGLGDLIRSVLPWPLHKPLGTGGGGACKDSNGINIGMICSLSIPIITICALILLIIIVSLLDLIFRWLPYFVMWFPVPGLKGKRG
jgi:hypothetical protein